MMIKHSTDLAISNISKKFEDEDLKIKKIKNIPLSSNGNIEELQS